MPNSRDPKLYFYDTIAERFDELTNKYERQRRIEIVFDELLAREPLDGRPVLDVGAGSGSFSQGAANRGARVTSLDISTRLLQQIRKKCSSRLVGADACALPFSSNAFDVVISSECIEHTLDPRAALREIHRVTRPGGLMVVTVPNQAWKFSAVIATVLKLRPFVGYEHWVGWFEMRRVLRELGATVIEMRGFNLIPPLFPITWPLLRQCDRLGKVLGPVMLNIAVLARKEGG